MKKTANYVLIPLLYSLVLWGSEWAYRHVASVTQMEKGWDELLFILLVVCCFRYSRFKVTKAIVFLFFFCSTVVNNIHFAVYEGWINAVNYYLGVAEYREVFTAGVPMLKSLALPILWGLAECLALLSILFIPSKKTAAADAVFWAALLFISARSFNTKQEHGIAPKASYGRVKSNYFSTGYLLGRVLPYKILNLSKVPVYKQAAPDLDAANPKPKVPNIIWIMGESESNMHVGTFGYERNTSPFLTEMLGKPGEAIVKEAYCAGVMTAVSLPTLFNAIPRPNGMEQINRGDTNLFRLAKNQGYKTYWLTAQPESEMNIISMIGRRWLDVVTYPSDFGRKRTEAAPDTTLLEQFDRLPLKGSNFIVLHQRGSHVPYGSLLKPEEKVFGRGNNVDEYDNTILATDRLIKDVYERLKKSKENWILIYTSDHGQNVTKTVANQGTNVAANYAVPLFIAASSPKVLEEAQGDFHRCTRSTHYQLSSFVIRLLGYKFEMPDCNSSVVNGRLLTGDDGYIVVRNGEGQRVQRPK